MTSHPQQQQHQLDDGIDDDIRAFFTQRDLDPGDLEAVRPIVVEAVTAAVAKRESHTSAVLPQDEDDDTNSTQEEADTPADDEQTKPQWKEDALVRGNPRDYVSAY
eukprot:scaffold12214_cov159-Amphora_coffeaeformis.AAC.8